MMEDKKYCMSSFLMFRSIMNHEKSFLGGCTARCWDDRKKRKLIHNSKELSEYLNWSVEKACSEKKFGLALSGGIDSASLARFMPKGSIAYTFKCVVPGVAVVDETCKAAEYAKECGLKHKVVEMHWEDFENYAPILMKHKGAPIHSIEVQIYKAALQAKYDGLDGLIFGETADCIYGGLDKLLSREWPIGDFIDRYSYVLPYKALKECEMVLHPYYEHARDGYIDPHEFLTKVFRLETMGSYTNAMETADMLLVCPFAETELAVPLDYERIRRGENKYLVREMFERLYPGFSIPPKTPMPRPMDEWFDKWEGPVRPEFWPHCTNNMTGDQKWLVWALERFLNMLDNEKKK
ncbi:MAG: asparagine synthase [Lachnospiraceae bacterium]|nr:asparagine synthase [Lachnospiraceae bacterium]